MHTILILVETAKQLSNGCAMQCTIRVPLHAMYDSSCCTVCVSHLIQSVFLILAALMGRECCLPVILICGSLMPNELEHLLIVYWPFGFSIFLFPSFSIPPCLSPSYAHWPLIFQVLCYCSVSLRISLNLGGGR